MHYFLADPALGVRSEENRDDSGSLLWWISFKGKTWFLFLCIYTFSYLRAIMVNLDSWNCVGRMWLKELATLLDSGEAFFGKTLRECDLLWNPKFTIRCVSIFTPKASEKKEETRPFSFLMLKQKKSEMFWYFKICFDMMVYKLYRQKKLWSEKEEKWQTVFSICLFKFCICSTIRRTSDSTIFSGSLFISAFLCWAYKSKVYHHFDHLYQIKKSNHDYTIRQNSNARKIRVHQSLQFYFTNNPTLLPQMLLNYHKQRCTLYTEVKTLHTMVLFVCSPVRCKSMFILYIIMLHPDRSSIRTFANS